MLQGLRHLRQGFRHRRAAQGSQDRVNGSMTCAAGWPVLLARSAALERAVWALYTMLVCRTTLSGPTTHQPSRDPWGTPDDRATSMSLGLTNSWPHDNVMAMSVAQAPRGRHLQGEYR